MRSPLAISAAPSLIGALTFGNMEMATTFTGVARAAFEHSLAYAHERKQGGTAIINHQSVRLRIFDMWRKLEAGRALARRVFTYNYSPNGPAHAGLGHQQDLLHADGARSSPTKRSRSSAATD